MIQLNEGICYSPQPLSAYEHLHLFEGQGSLARIAVNDLQMWNLMWLTEAGWDLFPGIKTYRDFTAVIKQMTPGMSGYCTRALTMQEDLDDFGTPTLRSLLKLPPRDFMRAFCKKDINCIELTAVYGQPLIQTMWSRARMSQPMTTDVGAAQFVEQAMGNPAKGNVIPFRQRA